MFTSIKQLSLNQMSIRSRQCIYELYIFKFMSVILFFILFCTREMPTSLFQFVALTREKGLTGFRSKGHSHG